ncbi:lytic transglycosylase domain-containing protein [Egibacter rhizosphaerae]|uniref:Lytic transglycosylase domain-containing protein n=1 Tax=Egibacter rhizosphaerae TaxID=1670831 RepID=A0A411YJE2_9ACTN|nr:lytic transglycosylase domain-containing protein [Egibacter rhizosphaerae]QBI21271.1 lytic transglycosylase domain-containing protein [Egibacter rhizosphaerae]
MAVAVLAVGLLASAAQWHTTAADAHEESGFAHGEARSNVEAALEPPSSTMRDLPARSPTTADAHITAANDPEVREEEEEEEEPEPAEDPGTPVSSPPIDNLDPDELVREAAAQAAERREPDEDDPLEAALAERGRVVDAIETAAEAQSTEPELALALAWHESRFDPRAVSHAGAVGVLQVKPRTAQAMAEHLDEPLDPTVPIDNAHAGLAFLQKMIDDKGGLADALVAYNQGPAALREHGAYPQAEQFSTDVRASRDQLREVDW